MSEPSNYRGIILCSCIGKLLSIIMNDRLVKYLNIKLCTVNITGLRKEHCTTDNIFIIVKLMSHYRKANEKLNVEFIDFRKAYDTFWRSTVMYKLLNMGIGGKCYHVLNSMYIDNNISSIKLNDTYAEYFDCPIGIHQGYGLSFTLFNLFVNDLQTLFNAEEER